MPLPPALPPRPATLGPRPNAQPPVSSTANVARKLEAQFLSEMLKSTGFGEARSFGGGGAGEAQFASFLREAVAERMVAAGGLGLAPQLQRSIEARHGQ